MRMTRQVMKDLTDLMDHDQARKLQDALWAVMMEIEKTRSRRTIDYYKNKVDSGDDSTDFKEGSEKIQRQLFNVMKPGHASEQIDWRIRDL